MKRTILAAALAIAGATATPAVAHSDVAIRVDLGWPAVVYVRDAGHYRPHLHGHYGYVEHRPVVIYRDGRYHDRHRRGHGHGHHHHDRHDRHDRDCRH